MSMQCVRGRREEMGLEHAEIILHSITNTACTGIYASSTLVVTIIIRRPHMTYVRAYNWDMSTFSTFTNM